MWFQLTIMFVKLCKKPLLIHLQPNSQFLKFQPSRKFLLSRFFSTNGIIFEYNENGSNIANSDLQKIKSKELLNFIGMFESNKLVSQNLIQEFSILAKTHEKQQHMKTEQELLDKVNKVNETKLQEIQKQIDIQETETSEIIKRMDKEIEKSKVFAVTKIAQNALEVLDNLDRSLINLQKNHGGSVHTQEINNVLEFLKKNMEQALAKFGIKKINAAVGDTVDPNFHHIVAFIPVPGQPDDQILDISQVGYMIEGRVLRAAKVIVVKN